MNHNISKLALTLALGIVGTGCAMDAQNNPSDPNEVSPAFETTGAVVGQRPGGALPSEGLPGASVCFAEMGGDLEFVACTSTDERGEYRLEGVPQQAVIVVELDGFAATYVLSDETTGPLEIELIPRAVAADSVATDAVSMNGIEDLAYMVPQIDRIAGECDIVLFGNVGQGDEGGPAVACDLRNLVERRSGGD